MSKPITECPCCGWSLELQARTDAVTDWFSKRSAEHLARRKEERKTKPVGDCQECLQHDIPCNMTCMV